MDNKLSKVIGERINTLLGVKHKKQKELANYLGVTDNTISYFCSGKRTPNTAQIGRIADFFNVSADYLLGRSEAKTTDKDLKFVCEYTGLSEESIIKFLQSDSALHSRMVDFLNVLAKSKAGSLRLESLMGNLAEYKLANMKIKQLNENVPISHIEEVQNEIDMCQFRAERDFRDLLPAYCGTVAYYVFDDKGE